MRIGFLHSLIRKDEKLLIEEFRKMDDVELVMIDDGELTFNIDIDNLQFDAVV